MDSRGLIFDVKRFSIHDGPGIRTTVFFKGCSLSCGWCHNPESISPLPQQVFHRSRCISCGKCSEGCLSGARETIGRWVGSSELYRLLERDLPFYLESGGGVTFSGGEPLLQRDFLGEMLNLCVQGGLQTVVDTSGYAPWQDFSGITGKCGLFLFDLKHVDPVKHRRFTGVDNGLILGNLRKLVSEGCHVRVRVPVAMGFNDDPVSMDGVASFLADLDGRVEVELLKCHGFASGKYKDMGLDFRNFEPSVEAMDAFRNILDSRGIKMEGR